MKAKDILEQAASLVSGDRRETHGDAKASYQFIASIWSARLGVTVTAADVCWMMTDVKYSRSKFGAFNNDDFVDGAGYIGLAAEVSDA